MEWLNKDRVAYMRLERFEELGYFVTDKTGKSIKVLSEFDAKGWLDKSSTNSFFK